MEHCGAEGSSCPGTRIIYFKNNITAYIYAEGEHASVTEGLCIFTNDVMECID